MNFKNIFKRKKKFYYIHWKHTFNETAIIYPTQMGWEKIESMFSEKYVEDRRTEENGYKDNMWCIIEDLGELFSHGSDYIHSNFEIEEQI